ncbi:FAD:protein FMN transferase [Mesobacterium pallidum]|uniref:FAD:protein FMN transferase n=1 Tax=Mesobacterium pallidum TaxID=2872037 RepID=UPI001EE1DA0A|nr:FAD:protein FMN transferase [Mesobacterium pallidum]
MNRRRFLALSASFSALMGSHASASAYSDRWDGVALGADVSVTLSGPRPAVREMLADLPQMLDRIEETFSLYRPTSALMRLNTEGALPPNADFDAILGRAAQAHRLTGGLFDPTIQPLWQALANSEDPGPARALIGWDRVRRGPAGTRLAPGQQLTFNGIAQGFATDLVRRQLAARGFTHALVNLGEYAALGGPFRLGLSDPAHGPMGQRTLTGGAIATSSPGALHLGDTGHILSPDGRPALWSTVSIEGPSATLADALSTAAVFLPRPELARLKTEARLTRITVISPDGDLSTL